MKKQRFVLLSKLIKLLFYKAKRMWVQRIFPAVFLIFFSFIIFLFRVEGAFENLTVPELEKLTLEDPENKEAFLQLGIKYSVEKKYSKAVDAYFSLLRIDSGNFHAYNNLGIVYKKAGQFKDSLYCYQQALRINPDHYWVHYNIGLVYEAMGRMQEAREAYGRALSLNPEFSQALQRLRELSENPGKIPALPSPPTSNILVVDSTGAKPILMSFSKEVPPKKPFEPSSKSAAQKPSVTVKPAPPPPGKIVRSSKEGTGSPFYLKAMDALEKNDLKTAVEEYVRCILKDREFLAEPDNGLIQKSLELLLSRPNSMSEGLFFRGFLHSLQGRREPAMVDLKSYMTGNPKGPFLSDAKKIVDRYEAAIAAEEAAAKRQEIAQRFSAAPDIVQNATFTPRPDAISIAKLSVDEVLEEAKRLSREGRQRDAIVTLRTCLEKEANNSQVLFALANCYTDLMLLRGDLEAGKMARDIFEKVLTLVSSDSKEAGIARAMVKELSGRIR